MQKLKFVWGSIFCLVGTLSLIASLKMMAIMAAVQQIAVGFIGGGVGTYNTIQMLTQEYQDSLTGGYILCGVSIFFMIVGSLMVYDFEDLPLYSRK